jgi:glycosyltransferase involved in cell wall biosynthesis
LSIALEALAKTTTPNDFRLHIVGSGTDEEVALYKQQAKELGVDNLCTWYGKIPNAEVQKLMREKDLFFFTSVFEGGPHVVLESITNNIPILCFDTCGQGVVVDDTIGYKIPLTNHQEGVEGFAEKLDYINAHREELPLLSANCTKKQNELSWENKVKNLLKIYESITK